MRRIISHVTLAAALLAGVVSTASATTLTFDNPNIDNNTTYTLDGTNYGGFSWQNFVIADPSNGWASKGIVSGDQLAEAPQLPSVSSFWSATPFFFESIYATNPKGGSVIATFTGTYAGGGSVTTGPITLASPDPVLVTFNWNNVTKVDVTSTGAGGTAGFLELDDLTYGAISAPEPVTSAALIISGLGIVAAARRRRSAQAA
jgi:hypothetical protein